MGINPFLKHFEALHYEPELRQYLDKYPGVRKRDDESSDQYKDRMLDMVKRGLDMVAKNTTPDYSNPKTPTRPKARAPVPIEGSDKDPFWSKFRGDK